MARKRYRREARRDGVAENIIISILGSAVQDGARSLVEEKQEELEMFTSRMYES